MMLIEKIILIRAISATNLVNLKRGVERAKYK
jgi:hypothetical protein